MAASIYFQAFKTSLQAKLEYRSDFFMGIGASLGLQLAGLSSLWVVLNQTRLLVGWTGPEIVLLFGLTSMIQGLSEVLFNHIWYVPSYIVRGQIDRLLAYPVKSLPFFLLTSPELHAFGNMAGGLVTYCVAGYILGQPWWAYACLPYWVICGCLIYTASLVLCGALSFVILDQRGQQFSVAVSLLQATRYPVGIFPNAIQILLLFILPFGAANYLPVGWSLGKSDPLTALLAPGIAAAVSTWVAFKVWNLAIKKYESSGS